MPVEHFLRGTTPYVRYRNSYGKVWEEPAEVAFFEAGLRKDIYTQIAQAAPAYVKEKTNFTIKTHPHGSLAEEVCQRSSDLDILIIFSVSDFQEYIWHAAFWMATLTRENSANKDVFCGVSHKPISLDLYYAIYDESIQQEIPVNPFKKSLI